MKNFFFKFPFEEIKKNSCIALYGAGNVGTDYYYQMKESGYCNVKAWMDSDPCIRLENPLVCSAKEGVWAEYDILIIAVFEGDIADQIKSSVIKSGMDEKRIFWKKPVKTDLFSYITADPFIAGICEWRKDLFFKNDETFWNLYRSAEILVEAYKRVFVSGRYDKREWYTNKSKKVAYLNNAKAACTSLKASIREYNANSNYQEVNDKLSKEALTDGEVAEVKDFFKFTFVRNPFARLVSCYKNKYYTDKELLGADCEDLYFGITRYLMGFLQENNGFKEFIKKVYLIPIPWQDRHFRSQYDLIYKNGECCVDYVGRFEDLPTAYEGIREKYQLLQLGHYNNSGDSDWMEYYDLETAQIVYEKYEQDISTFGYKEDYQKLLEFCMGKK